MLKYLVSFILVGLICWWILTGHSGDYYVTAITDGDTIKVVKDKVETKIRLAHIDAPESKQAFGSKAKQALSEKLFNKYVNIEITGHDRYGRTLAVIVYNGRNINLEMIQEGWVWHYKQFSKEGRYGEAMEKAKEKKLGLWVDKKPIPPWEFRSR